MTDKPVKKVVLAYSGGLESSTIVKWLQTELGAEVATFTADLGQGEEVEPARQKAISLGVKPENAFVEDVREEFVRDYVFPMFRANTVYEGQYLLGTSIARPLIAKKQIEIARKVGADAVAHGATGKGNDQVRFEMTFATLAPELPVIAPWREWDIRSREDAIDYAAAKGIPITATKEKIYSRDANLWHLSHEGGNLEDPNSAPKPDMFMLTAEPSAAPDEAEDVVIGFAKGTPVTVNGVALGPFALVSALNAIGGKHGVGRIDLVEDRMVGMKSRGVYETPGGTLLYTAHSELEQLILDRKTLSAKDVIAPRYADLVYEGRWWTTEREAYDAFVDVTQERITGTVTLRLYKGGMQVVGRQSEHALYDERFVTFGEDDVYQQSDAAGFIRLFALPARVRAIKDQELAASRAADNAPTPIGELAGV